MIKTQELIRNAHAFGILSTLTHVHTGCNKIRKYRKCRKHQSISFAAMPQQTSKSDKNFCTLYFFFK